MTGRYRAANDVVGRRQHLHDGRDARLDGGARAAGVLHHQRVHQVAGFQALTGHQICHLVALAAQSDNQHTRQVRMPRVARQRAAQHIEMLGWRRHPAAARLRKCHHAIHIGKQREALRREPCRNVLDDGRRAVDRRQDADEVARSHAAIGADDAIERSALRLWDVIDRAHIQTEARVACVVDQLDVVRVDVFARRDVACGAPDDRVVLADGFALGDSPRGDLVAGRHLRAQAHRRSVDRQVCAERQPFARNQHVVCRVQLNQRPSVRWGCLQHPLLLRAVFSCSRSRS